VFSDIAECDTLEVVEIVDLGNDLEMADSGEQRFELLLLEFQESICSGEGVDQLKQRK
jgi:hypothetical protein